MAPSRQPAPASAEIKSIKLLWAAFPTQTRALHVSLPTPLTSLPRKEERLFFPSIFLFFAEERRPLRNGGEKRRRRTSVRHFARTTLSACSLKLREGRPNRYSYAYGHAYTQAWMHISLIDMYLFQCARIPFYMNIQWVGSRAFLTNRYTRKYIRKISRPTFPILHEKTL